MKILKYSFSNGFQVKQYFLCPVTIIETCLFLQCVLSKSYTTSFMKYQNSQKIAFVNSVVGSTVMWSSNNIDECRVIRFKRVSIFFLYLALITQHLSLLTEEPSFCRPKIEISFLLISVIVVNLKRF